MSCSANFIHQDSLVQALVKLSSSQRASLLSGAPRTASRRPRLHQLSAPAFCRSGAPLHPPLVPLHLAPAQRQPLHMALPQQQLPPLVEPQELLLHLEGCQHSGRNQPQLSAQLLGPQLARALLLEVFANSPPAIKDCVATPTSSVDARVCTASVHGSGCAYSVCACVIALSLQLKIIILLRCWHL